MDQAYIGAADGITVISSMVIGWRQQWLRRATQHMEPLQFKDIRELLNACRLTRIDETATNAEKGCWELYRGSYRAHVVEVPFEVLYFLADATRDAIKRARLVYKPGETFVVYAPSSKLVGALREDFGSARGFWSTTEYLASFMGSELEAYRKALQNIAPAHYVDPPIAPPAGTIHRFPNPLKLFLLDAQTSAEQEGRGSIAVVLAEAGHGKTFMCEWLVAKLASADTGILPIFVNSSQWQTLRPEELGSLGATIVSSFRQLGTPIPWVEGQEELFLRVGLKAGLFGIVFDGFDEYCLRAPGGISASDTLAAISTLASDTGARVIVTSRSSFWESELPIEHDELRERYAAANVYVYRLSPFTPDFARNYFSLRFPANRPLVDKAVSAFTELARHDESFAGRGFVLLLVADLVESGEWLDAKSRAEKPLLRLMRAHCERERKRQQLPLTAEQQLEALRLLVFETTSGTAPTNDLMSLAIQLAAPELRESDVQSAVEKMQPHALIQRTKGSWRIRQPQIEVALLALQLIYLVRRAEDGANLLAHFALHKLDPGMESDLASMLTSVCTWGESQNSREANVRELTTAFLRASPGNIETFRQQPLRRLATAVALRTAADEPGPLSHKERAALFLRLFPGGACGIVLFGGVARFDWSGVIFDQSVLDNVRWSNCTFDEGTTFRNCHVLGGSAQHCQGFASVQWTSCYMDEAGRQFRDLEAFRAGQRGYSDELLKRDILCVLEKFVGKGGVGFRTLETEDIGKGKIAISPFKNEIIDGISRYLLEGHRISGGTRKGLNVKDEARDAIRALFANNVWVGEIGALLVDLRERLRLVGR